MKNNSETIKGTEIQALAMARQTLGRVKEMDLTPEQKTEVMNFIEEAKAHEDNKDLAKALNVYHKLMKFLKQKEGELKEGKDIINYEGFEIKSKQAEVLLAYERYLEDLFEAVGDKKDVEEIRGLIKNNIKVQNGNIVKFKLSLYNPENDGENIKWVNFFTDGSTRNLFLKFPDLSELKELQELDLSHNFWDYEPINFSNLKKLKNLNLDGTRFKDTPDISALRDLEQFSCRDTEVPDLTKLTSLRKLDISECVANKFPDLRTLSKLEELTCDELKLFSPDFTGLDNLKFLSCRGCHLVKLPDFSHLKKLEILLWSKNTMTEKPDLSQLVNLQELDLSKNLLDELPDLSANKKLQRLVCFGNNLSWLQIKRAALKLPKGCKVINKEKS